MTVLKIKNEKGQWVDVPFVIPDIPEIDTSELATKEELNQKQDKITDLDTIRANASKGATAVQPKEIPVTDVQVNGASVLSEGIANIPVADGNHLGVVKTNTSYGIEVVSGNIATISASENIIDAKLNGRQIISAKNLDYAVKSGITANAITLTDTEKTNACNWLGTNRTVLLTQADYDSLETKSSNTLYLIEET